MQQVIQASNKIELRPLDKICRIQGRTIIEGKEKGEIDCPYAMLRIVVYKRH